MSIGFEPDFFGDKNGATLTLALPLRDVPGKQFWVRLARPDGVFIGFLRFDFAACVNQKALFAASELRLVCDEGQLQAPVLPACELPGLGGI